MTTTTPLSDIGFIGLGVMGKSLVLNLADNGYTVAGFDLSAARCQTLVAQDAQERGQQEPRVHISQSIEQLIQQTVSPRVIMLSVPAGEVVDQVCQQLLKAGLTKDDIVVDTGNSLWSDSVARQKRYQGQFMFFTTAVSGGEVGARFGPSLMPSGQADAWQRLEPIFAAIAAKVDPATGLPNERTAIDQPLPRGEPCSTYIGDIGSGHYVKMVHNGIEYADMQLICEAYQIMRDGLHMTAVEIAAVFREWDKGELNSYLMQISADVLEKVDQHSQKPLVECILDKAGQKGTGLWTAVDALQLGSPAQTIAQAVFARSLSSLKNEREQAANMLTGAEPMAALEREQSIAQLRAALYCAKICAYAQGFQLMATAANTHHWQLDFAAIAKIWRAGCIIRAGFLQSIASAYQAEPDLSNLMIAPFFSEQLANYQQSWRQAVAQATLQGIPCAALSSALNYYDSYRCNALPANLLQGQRDYFGAHTYQRIDRDPEQRFHTRWSEPGQPEEQID